MNQRGYTLIELMVALAVMALVLLATVPLTISWTNSTYVIEGKDLVQQAYAKTRALALSNPSKVMDGTVAAYLCSANSKVYVQPISQISCGTGSVWSADVKTGATLTVSGSAFSCLGVNNLGRIVSSTVGLVACTTSKVIIVTKGGQTDGRALY